MMTSASENSEALIHCRNLSLGYGSEIVLKDVSLDIPSGVFMPFVGPNGAGKTTLLRAFLGLVPPLKGFLKTPFERLLPGYVPQLKSIDPLFPVTVREVVMMGLYPRLGWWRRPGKAERDEVEAAIEELRLAAHADKNYRELSGGNKQKTLMARAWVSGAEVFILDEPSSELDEATERDVFQHLHAFVKDKGRTVLMAHHGVRHPFFYPMDKVCLVSQGQARIVSSRSLNGTGDSL